MLTTDQKEAILQRAGVPVPQRPSAAGGTTSSDREARDSGTGRFGEDTLAPADESAPGKASDALMQWRHTIESLYVEYVARRAAKSLRDAEEVRRFGALQRAGQ